jgi:hypothetical protein
MLDCWRETRQVKFFVGMSATRRTNLY